MRKLFFIPLVLGIGLNSCNFGNSGNTDVFWPMPAVVDYDLNMGGFTMGTELGIFAAPSLMEYYPGDCLYLHEFTVDYDNQPFEYRVATNIVRTKISKSYITVEENNSTDIGDYSLPLLELDGASVEFYRGNFFVLATSNDENPDLRMVFNSEEPETEGRKNLYVLAKASSPNPSSLEEKKMHAFDLYYFISDYGRDTTLNVSGFPQEIKYKYVKVNLKYLSGISGDDIPTFGTVERKFDIYYPLSY